MLRPKNNKWLIPIIAIIVLLLLNYGSPYVDYYKYHKLFTLISFILYFIILGFGAFWFIKRKKTVLANLFILIILFFATELICYFALGMPLKEKKDYSTPNLEKDHIAAHLGHVPWADSVWHDVKIDSGKTLFDAHYTIDKLNKRVTPEYDESKNKYAIFFGCSVAFGYGLMDNQTTPYFVQENTENYNAYNYAYSGWGSNHMLARLEHKNLSKEITEKEGVGIYVFIWSHIRRSIGDMRIYTGWGHTMPYYYLDGENLVRDGNFAQGRWLMSKLYECLGKSYIWDCFEVNLPVETSEEHMNLTVEIISKSKERYIEQFGNDNFYVIIYPSDWRDFTPEKNEILKKMLESKEIDYLDYSQKIKMDDNYIIIGDGHPNAKSNEIFAKMLIEDLELK